MSILHLPACPPQARTSETDIQWPSAHPNWVFPMHPRYSGGPQSQAGPAADRRTSRSRARILLADDEPAVRALLASLLSRQGYQVTAVSDGRAALEAWQDSSTAFDLVILDVRMPGMGGVEAYRRLRAAHPDGVFMFITGYADENVPELTGPEAPPLLSKPFELNKLLNTVRDLLA